MGSSSTALTCGAGVSVGSGAMVAVGAGTTVCGGDEVGTLAGVSCADSQANTRNIADNAAMAAHEMVLEGILRISDFVMIIGLFPRCVLSGGHFLERGFGGGECFVDVVYFDPSHMTYTEYLASEFALTAPEDDVMVFQDLGDEGFAVESFG